jgi:hypothetical protein
MGQTDPDCDAILQEKGIDMLPDILCNAGGVAVTYFERLQNKRSESWNLKEVDTKLHKKMVSAYEWVRNAARSQYRLAHSGPHHCLVPPAEGVQGTRHLSVRVHSLKCGEAIHLRRRVT